MPDDFEALYAQLPTEQQVRFAKLITLLSNNNELLESLKHKDADGITDSLRQLIEGFTQEPSVGA